MQSRRSVFAFIGSLVATGPVLAALPPDAVARVERYLNSIRTLRGDFTQIDHQNRLARGRVFIQRPGRLRFEYEPPERILLIATDWRLVMYDDATKQTTTIPVDRTPLGLLLDDPIKLTGAVTIRGMAEVNGELHLTVVKTDEPGLGTLELFFGMEPMKLRRWRVIDAQGKSTEVLLENVETNIELEPGLFRTLELQKRG